MMGREVAELSHSSEADAGFQILEETSGTRFFCAADETVLCAAQRAGIGIAYECSVGGCGSCKLDLVSGDIHEIADEAPGLRPREKAKGKRLACQISPRSDAVVRFRTDQKNLAPIPPQRFEATFLGSSPITHDISEFRFKAPVSPTFEPGQYAMVFLPGLPFHRPYSLSNIDTGEKEWHFMVRRVPGGEGTDVLFNHLAVGQSVLIDGPYSVAYLQADIERDIVLIGGGSGLAPMISIIRGVAALETMSARSVKFFFGGRTPRDIPDINQFGVDVAERCEYLPAISELEDAENDEWRGGRGFIHEVAAAKLGSAAPDYEYYMAGPPPMIEAVRRMLVLDLKVPVEQIHYDRFF